MPTDQVKMNFRRIPTLSKSRFLAGLQCPLRLWHQCYNPHLAPEASPVQQAIFDTGHEVGRLATSLFPGGRLIGEDYLHHNKAVIATKEAMNDPAVPAIFEAAFLYDGVRIRVDILERLGNGTWNLIEVKSSTSIKEVYLADIGIQYYVINGAGFRIARAGIMHLNNRYVYDGINLEPGDLFSFSDLTERVIQAQEQISDKLDDQKQMLKAGEAPEVVPSRFCNSPHHCEFWGHCIRKVPEFWIVNLSGITQDKLDDLMSMNIQDIRDIPPSFGLNPLQERIRRCSVSQEEYLSPSLAPELQDVVYPVHFLDFETVAPAIPRYPGTRPYYSIPFQFSNHALYKDGALEHREYLCIEDIDPREEFVRNLLKALGEGGTIFTYTLYEKRIMGELAEHLPRYRRRLLAATTRFKDLHSLVKRYFYHPYFHGSFSLKYILPALIPEMNYEHLDIHEGTQASLEYLRMIDSSTPKDEKERINRALRAYCVQDTMAMVKIREQLLRRSKRGKDSSG
jgi:hypothetical protein